MYCYLWISSRHLTQYAVGRKIREIILAYGIPSEIVSTIMFLYENATAKVRSPDGDTDFSKVLAGVLQGDTVAPYLFIICLDYVLRTSIDALRDQSFTLKERRNGRYPASYITIIMQMTWP